MGKNNKERSVVFLIFALMLILIGGVLFIGAISGWFDDPKTILSQEYHSDNPELAELSPDEYEKLIGDKKSFIIFVDQDNCVTADRLREYIGRYMSEKGVSVHHMMFSSLKESSLHSHVKYYPSIVIIDKGKVRVFLRADSDEDSDAYNNYDSFIEWISKYL